MSNSYGSKGNLQYHSCFFYAAESEDFIMKLTYHRNGDYQLPDIGLTEAEQPQPLCAASLIWRWNVTDLMRSRAFWSRSKCIAPLTTTPSTTTA